MTAKTTKIVTVPQRVIVEPAFERPPTLEEVEADYISEVLEATKGNKSEAARVLGIDRRTLYRKIEEYERKALPTQAEAG